MKNLNAPRRLAILDATITAIKTNREWTTAHVAELCSVPKSVVYHYLESKSDLVRCAFARYAEKANEVCDVAFNLAIWVAMRHDDELARAVRAHRENEREFLKIKFGGHREAWLAQALYVGLGIMRESGVEVDEEAIVQLFSGLVFDNQVLNNSPEVKAGIDQELSA